MNEYYQDMMSLVVYKWICSMENAKVGRSTCSVCFCNEKYHASIAFCHDNVLELSIMDKDSDESVFYLHFEMLNLNMVVESVKAFFEVLKNDIKQEVLNIKNQKNIKILLCCTSGLSTSYFAYLMQEALSKEENCIEMNAVSYMEIESMADDYDMILLAPQISYKYASFREKYGQKVYLIDMMDFASGNVNRVINQIMNKEERKCYQIQN